MRNTNKEGVWEIERKDVKSDVTGRLYGYYQWILTNRLEHFKNLKA
jgi:hypothetical protein